jgi:hypothetical protein
MAKVCWRDLRSWKYQLLEDYLLDVSIRPAEAIDTRFIDLDREGSMTIRAQYAWDGPSGPTIDTRSFMRGSLVHDALYQLMRESCLDHEAHRAAADRLLRHQCIEDGMWRIRAFVVYWMVRWFGEKHARPGPKPKEKVVCAP